MRVSNIPEYIEVLNTVGLIECRKSSEALGETGDERGVLPLIDAMEKSIDNCTVCCDKIARNYWRPPCRRSTYQRIEIR